MLPGRRMRVSSTQTAGRQVPADPRAGRQVRGQDDHGDAGGPHAVHGVEDLGTSGTLRMAPCEPLPAVRSSAATAGVTEFQHEGKLRVFRGSLRWLTA